MRFDLRAHSAIGLYALFDPLSVPTLLRGRSGPFRNLTEFLLAVAEAPTTGDMLTYHAEWDGELRLRIYIDEPLDASVAGSAKESLRNSLLRVPSGRLIFLGAESIAGKDPQHLSPDRYLPLTRRPGMEAWIPAVDYRVTAYEIGEQPRVPEDIARELKSHAETIRRFHRHSGKVGLLTFACVPLALFGVMVAYSIDVPINLAAMLALVIFLAAAWWSVVRQWRSPAVQLAFERRRELRPHEEARWPEVIIALQPLDGPAPLNFNPARLGPGVARHYKVGDPAMGAG